MSPSVCRTCKAPVRWAATAAGRAIPLDPEPNPDGNLWLDARGVAHNIARLTDDEQAEIAGDPLYIAHFVTCPDAAQHRRPR